MNREEFKAEQNSTPNKIVLNNVIKRTEQNRTDEKSRTRQTKKKPRDLYRKSEGSRISTKTIPVLEPQNKGDHGAVNALGLRPQV